MDRERVLLKIGGMCTSDCTFCHAGGPRHGSALPLRDVCRRVLAARDRGFGGVVLSGGEPTAHPRFLEIARFVEKAGLQLGLVTNGIALARPELRSAVVRGGLSAAHVTLLGPDPRTHDRLAGVRSFEHARSAIAALAGIAQVTISVTTVVTTQNLDALVDTVGLVSELLARSRSAEPPSHRLALLEPKGRALRDPGLVPGPAMAAEAIGRAIELGARAHGDRAIRGFDGLPPCLAPARSSGARRLDLRAFGITHMQEADEDRLYPFDAGRCSFARGCERCSLRSECSGLYSAYLPAHEGNLVPRGLRDSGDDHHEP